MKLTVRTASPVAVRAMFVPALTSANLNWPAPVNGWPLTLTRPW